VNSCAGLVHNVPVLAAQMEAQITFVAEWKLTTTAILLAADLEALNHIKDKSISKNPIF